MNCKAFENNILFFIDDDLDKRTSIRFNEHLESCSHCKQLFEDIANTYGYIEKNRITESNPFFYTRVKTSIENQKNQHSAFYTSKKMVLQWVTYTVIGVLALFAGYFIANDKNYIAQESIQKQYEKTDEELFADSHYLTLSTEDLFIVTAEEAEE